jgi:hypothetical protein
VTPRLVVHVGAAKTATTFLQHALHDNEKVLSDLGVYMPAAGRFQFSAPTILHHNLAWEYLEPARFDPEAGGWDALVEEVEGSPAEVILLSSESLERMTHSTALREVFESQLKRISDDVTILFVVRDQLSYLNSLYNQNIKSLRSTETFDAYIARVSNTDQTNLEKRFRPWYSSNDFDFVALPFEELVSGNVLHNFLAAAHIDLPVDMLETPRLVSNESLGPVGVEAARLLGGYLRILDPAFDHRSHAALKLYRAAARKARENGWCNESFWGWDPAQAEALAAREKDSNARFARSVWGPHGRLDLPVDKPQRTARLVDQSAETLSLVHRFVGSMSRRYLNLVSGHGPTPSRRSVDTKPDDTATDPADGYDQSDM